MFIVMMLPTLLIDAEAKTTFFKEIKKIVVLDPGHGGHDTGAEGPDNSQEKNVTLKMATALATELKKEYKIEFTRTGDYGLDIPGRTNMANHMQADLFISIHTGDISAELEGSVFTSCVSALFWHPFSTTD